MTSVAPPWDWPYFWWLGALVNLAAAAFLSYQVWHYGWLRPHPHPYVAHARFSFWLTVALIGLNAVAFALVMWLAPRPPPADPP